MGQAMRIKKSWNKSDFFVLLACIWLADYLGRSVDQGVFYIKGSVLTLNKNPATFWCFFVIMVLALLYTIWDTLIDKESDGVTNIENSSENEDDGSQNNH
ncbi:hypothetical protein [Teredinibacter turnerae]|uniref:hypothetical protein n=1 Tax=Teredinibacter turnerae TaxID=2426 RepID=UPI0005F82E4F|nr:hypothetical protein [Teredinibacter turnerae]